MAKRVETDYKGEIQVPTDHYWGAQTQRSIQNFPIGVDRFRWQPPMIRALGILKKSTALVNAELGELPEDIAKLIVQDAVEVIAGKLKDEFPLVVFLSGSGTLYIMIVHMFISKCDIEIYGCTCDHNTPLYR